MNYPNLSRRILAKFRLLQLSNVWNPDELLKAGGSATLKGGQFAFLGAPNTIEGTAVIDGFFWPPDDVRYLKEPINLSIKNRVVTDISGCAKKSKILSDWLEGKEKRIEHFCIGFNPGARISENMIEAERSFGHITVGIGKYPFHTDGIIKHPKIIIDNTVILENNKFIHDELLILEEKFPYLD